MDSSEVLKQAGNGIYVAMGLAALYGMFCVVMLFRRISQKRFSSDNAVNHFLEKSRDLLVKKDYQGVLDLCDTPPYWSKAVPQLIMVAIDNRHRPMSKLRRIIAERFEREILADLEYRTSWVGSIVKSAPMLGLLGTVMGMINAFAKIATATSSGTDPKMLAEDISFALLTTALGLTIAIPLVLAGNAIHVRIGKLQDAVQQHMGIFLDDLEIANTEDSPATTPA